MTTSSIFLEQLIGSLSVVHLGKWPRITAQLESIYLGVFHLEVEIQSLLNFQKYNSFVHIIFDILTIIRELIAIQDSEVERVVQFLQNHL